MSTLRRWAPLVGLALIVGALGILTASPPSSPNHEVTSDAAGGTSALRQLAEVRGRSTAVVEGQFDLPVGGELFLFSPTEAFTNLEADRVRDWVAAGGVLVYAAETGLQPLDETLGLRRADAFGGEAQAASSQIPGVQRVAGNFDSTFVPAAGQAVLLTATGGAAVALSYSIGSGTVVALSDAGALSNGDLEAADNAVLAAGLIDLAPAGATVLFDEYHHGAQSGGSAASALYAFPWGRALVWAVLVLFVGTWLRGRVVGAPEPIDEIAPPTIEEHMRAVGQLLRRTSARRPALDLLLAATRRAIARRTGAPAASGPEDFNQVLARFDPESATRLREAETDATAVGSDEQFAAVAQRLHSLAYPMAPQR